MIEANHGLAQRQPPIVGWHQMMSDDLEAAFVQLAFREFEKAHILENSTGHRNGVVPASGLISEQISAMQLATAAWNRPEMCPGECSA
jgi:hypothetical protein